MMKYALPFVLLGLLLTPSCRHRAGAAHPRYSHEEATPVSSLPDAEFYHVNSRRSSSRH